MTLNDLLSESQVHSFFKCRKKMTKYGLVMTLMPCRVAGGIISIRPLYLCARALYTYLLTYSEHIKPAVSPKQLEDTAKLLLTAYIKSYTVFRLPRKCMILNDLWARFKVIDSLNAAKTAKCRLVMTRHRVDWLQASFLLGLCIPASVHSLTHLHSTSVLCDCPGISGLFSEWFVYLSTAFGRP